MTWFMREQGKKTGVQQCLDEIRYLKGKNQAKEIKQLGIGLTFSKGGIVGFFLLTIVKFSRWRVLSTTIHTPSLVFFKSFLFGIIFRQTPGSVSIFDLLSIQEDSI